MEDCRGFLLEERVFWTPPPKSRAVQSRKKFTNVDTFGAPYKVLSISDLGVFRVVKTPTLKMAKQLSLNNLQVAIQKRETKSSSLGVHYIPTYKYPCKS